MSNEIEKGIYIPHWIMEQLEFKGYQLVTYALFFQTRRPMTTSDIADNLCISMTTAKDAVQILCHKGYLKKYKKIQRFNTYSYVLTENFIPEEYR